MEAEPRARPRIVRIHHAFHGTGIGETAASAGRDPPFADFDLPCTNVSMILQLIPRTRTIKNLSPRGGGIARCHPGADRVERCLHDPFPQGQGQRCPAHDRGPQHELVHCHHLQGND
jgi:hypothetical protein